MYSIVSIMSILNVIKHIVSERNALSPFDIEELVYRDPFKQAVNRWLRAAEDASLRRDAFTIYDEILEPWLTTLVGPKALTQQGCEAGASSYGLLENYFYSLIDRKPRKVAQ